MNSNRPPSGSPGVRARGRSGGGAASVCNTTTTSSSTALTALPTSVSGRAPQRRHLLGASAAPGAKLEGALAPPPQYGDIVDSDHVHDEIKEIGEEVKGMIKEHLQRHATSERQVLAGVRTFGPSKQSRKILNKENEAARLAHETGVYCVWRCLETPALSGANNDFCCRIGYRHRCFCGHAFGSHAMPLLPGAKSVTLGKDGMPNAACEEAGCSCSCFRYVPNTPEEIGEAWLSRRSNWDPKKWAAKCRCGHGHRDHKSAGRAGGCTICGCYVFESHFLCVVCDKSWEAHATVYETEVQRARQGFPVREDYFPLAGIDWDVREMVLDDVTGGGALQAPAGYRQLGNGDGAAAASGRGRQLRKQLSDRVEVLPDEAGAGRKAFRGSMRGLQRDTDIGGGDTTSSGGGGGASPTLPLLVMDNTVDYCSSCATVYRKPESKFCSKCGVPRRR